MIIYKSTNTLNAKAYIGQTNRSLNKRKEEHIKAALKMRDGKNYFHWAIVEYGEESFKWEILVESKNQSELNELEKFFIKKYKTYDSKYGYNGSFGGQGEKRKKKLSELIRNWPKGIVKLSTTLESEGYTKDLLKKYVKSEWLDSLGYGAFKLHEDDVKWWGGLSSLQKVKNISIRPAGKTALELNGYTHYLSKNMIKIQLFGSYGEKLPKWYTKQEWMKITNYIQTNLFGDNVRSYLSDTEIQSIRLKISSPELAAMEMLYLIPKKQSFDEANKIMEGLTTLRPNLLQDLLENCNSVKVKRLFLYLAEKNKHPWFEDLTVGRVDLGSGKRVIVKDGRLDKKYNITVPKEYD
jgi:hypothetical protein